MTHLPRRSTRPRQRDALRQQPIEAVAGARVKIRQERKHARYQHTGVTQITLADLPTETRSDWIFPSYQPDHRCSH